MLMLKRGRARSPRRVVVVTAVAVIAAILVADPAAASVIDDDPVTPVAMGSPPPVGGPTPMEFPTESPFGTPVEYPLPPELALPKLPVEPPVLPPVPDPTEGWTSFSHWVRNEDGTISSRVSTVPIFRFDGQQWQPISDALTTGTTTGEVAVAAAAA